MQATLCVSTVVTQVWRKHAVRQPQLIAFRIMDVDFGAACIGGTLHIMNTHCTEKVLRARDPSLLPNNTPPQEQSFDIEAMPSDDMDSIEDEESDLEKEACISMGKAGHHIIKVAVFAKGDQVCLLSLNNATSDRDNSERCTALDS